MAGLVPAIHVLGDDEAQPWMPATSAGMTRLGRLRPLIGDCIVAYDRRNAKKHS
jgi:hypothetical protein